MTGTGISSLPDSVVNYRNVRSIDISGNKLTALPGAISRLKSLVSLNAKANAIRTVSLDVLAAPRLREVDLSGNPLSYVQPSVFELSSLVSIKLQNTPFSLHVPYANHSLTSLPPYLAGAVGSSVTSIDLSNNLLTEVPAELQESTGAAFTAIKNVSLRDNLMSSLPLNWRIQTVVNLDVSCNRLAGIPDRQVQFGAWLALKFLNISHNRQVWHARSRCESKKEDF